MSMLATRRGHPGKHGSVTAASTLTGHVIKPSLPKYTSLHTHRLGDHAGALKGTYQPLAWSLPTRGNSQ